MSLRIYVLLWAYPGADDALVAHEDKVLGFVALHGGTVLLRARSDGADGRPLEIQLLEFPSAEALDGYMANPLRAALASERERVIARTEFIKVRLDTLIDWSEFQRVELRVGTIVGAAPNPRAKKSAYVLTIDLGPLGMKTSSAQITDYYDTAELVGRQVLCVCNFAPKNVAGILSEVLVTGVHDRGNKVVLAGFDRPLPNGSRLK